MNGRHSAWEFPGAKNIPVKGLNDSGIETFRGNLIASLAREICQNSLDARPDRSLDGGEPVRVVFKVFDLPTARFPDSAGYRDSLEKSHDYWLDRGNRQSLQFLENARRVFGAKTMKWLRVSDFGTTGLTGVSTAGDCRRSSPWLGLVKSEGVSDKEGNSGGSFGIGKFAALACSKLRTVFYSTLTTAGERGHQGVARHMTYLADEQSGLLTFGTGFYGHPDSMPDPKLLTLDPDFDRGTSPGTDIFIPAIFDPKISDGIISSVLDGFMYAIWKNRLVVEVDDGSSSVTINAAWMAERYREDGFGDESVAYRYELLTLSATDWKVRPYGERGALKLALKAGRGRDSRIAMVREPGMLIECKKFGGALSYTGMLVVEGNLNTELKVFENPQHTSWTKNRCPERADLLDEVYGFCSKCIDELFQASAGEMLDSGLGDILPDESDDGEQRETEKLGVRKMTSGEKVPRKKTRRKLASALGRKRGEGKPGKSGKKSGKGVGRIGGSGDLPGLRYEVSHKFFRPICADPSSGSYRFKIIPERDAPKGAVDVIVVAEIRDYPAPVISASLPDGTPLAVKGSEISGFDFKKGERSDINVVLATKDYVSLEVDCHGYK